MPKDTLEKALHEDQFKKPLKYQPDHIDVDIRIHDTDNVDVTCVYHYKDKFPTEDKPAIIELDFEDLKLTPEERKSGVSPKSLLSLEIDGVALVEGKDYIYLGEKHKIHLNAPKDKNNFTLTARTNVDPLHNTTGVGLYMSDGNIFFKGETMNFRKIAPVQDRTDVLSTFNVILSQNTNAANTQNYNQLLSNGDLVDFGMDAQGYRFVRYEDKVQKPCYLMGVQAGEFATEEYSHTFTNGHIVKIFTHAPLKDKNKDKYVIEGIKRGMEYMDKEFGLIYDKPEYHITSLTTFNAGATETKSMPMFSAGYFTTDKDYVPSSDLLATMAVVIHEYIHEFIGNGFYINNWLELGCKEGQTVFLEQLATAAMLADPDVVRMTDMNDMVNRQFPKEDDQNLPPIPKALNSERDHYTATTYSKGAECFRMMHTLMGHDTYTKLIKEYVDSHLYQNASIDEFLELAEQYHSYDYTGKFARWFKQAGRATVSCHGHYKADTQEYVISLEQRFKDPDNKPLPIPLGVALCIDGKMVDAQTFLFDKENDAIVFKNVPKEPEAYSINRSFTAPVEIRDDQDMDKAIKLLAAESDGVTQLQIIQSLHNKEILKRYEALKQGQSIPPITNSFAHALKTLVTRKDIAPDVLANLLMPAPLGSLRTMLKDVTPMHLFNARDSYLNDIGAALYNEMDQLYTELRNDLAGPYSEDKVSTQKRTLAGCLLKITARAKTAKERQKIIDLYDNANNGEDRITACNLLEKLKDDEPAHYQRIMDDLLQYMSADTNGTLAAIDIMAAHTAKDPRAHLNAMITDPKYKFSWAIPHHGKHVGPRFAGNYKNFHAANGEGYEAIADMAIAAGRINPEVAGAIGNVLASLNSFDAPTGAKMYKALERIDNTPGMPQQLRGIVKDAMKAYDEKNSGQNGGSTKPGCNP